MFSDRLLDNGCVSRNVPFLVAHTERTIRAGFVLPFQIFQLSGRRGTESLYEPGRVGAIQSPSARLLSDE